MPPAITMANRTARLASQVLARPVFMALGLLTIAFCVLVAVEAFKLRLSDGSVWLLGRGPVTILQANHDPAAPPGPLRKHDTILGIANQMVPTAREAAAVLNDQRPGELVPYLIRRDEGTQLVNVPLTGYRIADRAYYLNILLAAIYLAIGFLVYIKSGNDRPARLFFLLCLCFAVYFLTSLDRPGYFWSDLLNRNGGALARFALPALFLHFFLVFPEPKRSLSRRPYLGLALYILPLLFSVRFTINQFYGDHGARISAGIWMVLGLYYLAGLVVLLHSYLSYRDPLLRERVRILTWGTLAAVLPFLVFKIGLEEINARRELAQFGVIPLAAIPVCFGYCVARYQVLQIDFLVKRSLLYSLASGLLLVAWGATVLWVGSRLVTAVGSSNSLIAAGVTIFAAAMLWPLRNQFQKALEVRLYRSRANLAALLDQFSREIPGLIQQQALFEHVGRNLQETLELGRLWFFLPQTSEPGSPWIRVWPDTLAHDRAKPATTPRQLVIPQTLRQIEARLEPLWIEPRLARQTANPRDPEGAAPDEDESLREQRRLAAGGLNLLVPLAVSGRILGLLALPARPGDETYQLHEVQLLTIVARQTAMQLENTRLYAEELAKQTLEEEMRLARSIQRRLLPESLPQLTGVQIDAVNLSSETVSGDYYDLIRREDGQIVLVIADVSGKGMPASLLASNLQAALRAQCDHWDSPGAILQRVNRQLHASTDSLHFATAFLAFLDPATRRLRYSTGGHDAPVLATGTGTLVKLVEGGLPLGAFDFGEYEEGEVQLADGDLLLLYTDGLTETRSRDDEDEFGTARLDRFLSEHRHLDTTALLADLERELRTFRGRNQADDDITMIALKVVQSDSSQTGGSLAAAARIAGSPTAVTAAGRGETGRLSRTSITPQEA